MQYYNGRRQWQRVLCPCQSRLTLEHILHCRHMTIHRAEVEQITRSNPWSFLSRAKSIRILPLENMSNTHSLSDKDRMALKEQKSVIKDICRKLKRIKEYVSRYVYDWGGYRTKKRSSGPFVPVLERRYMEVFDWRRHEVPNELVVHRPHENAHRRLCLQPMNRTSKL